MNQEELDWENDLVLDLVQAQLGLISSNIIAVMIRADKNRAELKCCSGSVRMTRTSQRTLKI